MENVKDQLSKFYSDLSNIFGDKLKDMYLYGSIIRGDFKTDTSDIDFLVFVEDKIEATIIEKIISLHEKYRRSSKFLKLLEGRYLAYNTTGIINGYYVGTKRSGWKEITEHGFSNIEQAMILDKYTSFNNSNIISNFLKTDFNKVKIELILQLKGFVESELINQDRSYAQYACITAARSLYTFLNKGFISKLDSIKWLEKNYFKIDFANPKRLINSILEMMYQHYLSDPCRFSALPLYKEFRYISSDVKVIHKDDLDLTYCNNIFSRFFRISHTLDEVEEVLISGYEFLKCNIDTDLDDIVDLINRSYDELEISKARIIEMTKDEVYCESLWKFVVDAKTSKKIALGICHYDETVGEVELDWIQVLPEYRGKGIGKMLVTHLLKTTSKSVTLATVSGDLDNVSSPEKLYRSCGFSGNDIWYIFK